MKALSLRQPWANLIVDGKKSIETRTWSTSYRGDIIIYSSKKPDIAPAGYALAIVELYDVVPMGPEHEEGACCEVYPGALAWMLRNIRKIDPPFKVKGSLGLFEVRKDG